MEEGLRRAREQMVVVVVSDLMISARLQAPAVPDLAGGQTLFLNCMELGSQISTLRPRTTER